MWDPATRVPAEDPQTRENTRSDFLGFAGGSLITFVVGCSFFIVLLVSILLSYHAAGHLSPRTAPLPRSSIHEVWAAPNRK